MATTTLARTLDIDWDATDIDEFPIVPGEDLSYRIRVGVFINGIPKVVRDTITQRNWEFENYTHQLGPITMDVGSLGMVHITPDNSIVQLEDGGWMSFAADPVWRAFLHNESVIPDAELHWGPIL